MSKICLLSLIIILFSFNIIHSQDMNEDGEYIVNKTTNTKNKQNLNNFVETWSRLMTSYDPDYTFTIKIPSQGIKVFYEEINEVPTYISGGYMINSSHGRGSKDKVSFKIVNPSGKILVDYTEDKYLYNEVKIEHPGKYTFSLVNNSQNNVKLTYTMELGHFKKLNTEDLNEPAKMLDKINTRVRQLKLIYKFKQNSNQERFKSKYSHNNNK